MIAPDSLKSHNILPAALLSAKEILPTLKVLRHLYIILRQADHFRCKVRLFVLMKVEVDIMHK